MNKRFYKLLITVNKNMSARRRETMKEQSELISAQEKLRFLPLLLDTIDKPVIVVNMEGQVVYFNQVAMDIFGWSSKNNHLDFGKEIVEPSVMELVQKNIQALEQGQTLTGDYIVTNPKGMQYQTRIRVTLIKDRGEDIICLVCEPHDRPEFQRLKTANKILTDVDTVLGDEVNYDTMLKKLVEFVTPQLADICLIHLLQSDGSFEQMALAPIGIIKNDAIHEWLRDDLTDDDFNGLPVVLHSGVSILIPDVNPSLRAGRAGIVSYMVLPLITHKQVRGAITFISTDPSRHFNQETLDLTENLAINVSIYLEKNRLYKESQKLKEELEQRVVERTAELSEANAQLKQSEQVIQTLFRISKKLNTTLDVDLILDELALEAIKIVNGESGFAGLRTETGMQVKKFFQRGNAIPVNYTWELGEGIPGWVLKYKVPYGTSDAINDPLINRELLVNENVRSIICTPILDSIGEVIGYFDIQNKIGAEGFSINDQEMLLTLAPVASIAIQNALAYQRRLETVAELKESSKQLEELAAKLESTREEERMRIARELHDQLGQSLTAIKFDLTSLTNQISPIDENLAHKAKDIMTQLNTMIKTVRRISTELRPGMLDDLGLIASIEWQAGDFQKRTGIECHVNAPGNNLNLTHEQSLALFRIFQEALTNVVRYAGAKHVEINLTTDGDLLIFEFRDDGRGIRAEEISGGRSLGLLGMSERVKHIGGKFEISGKTDQGTTIRVTIPMMKSN